MHLGKRCAQWAKPMDPTYLPAIFFSYAHERRATSSLGDLYITWVWMQCDEECVRERSSLLFDSSVIWRRSGRTFEVGRVITSVYYICHSFDVWVNTLLCMHAPPRDVLTKLKDLRPHKERRHSIPWLIKIMLLFNQTLIKLHIWTTVKMMLIS